MKVEQTLVLLKPGVIERAIVGEIISRFERKGLKLSALKMCKPTKVQYTSLYMEHVDKGFYKELMEYMQSGYIIAMVWAGPEAVSLGRALVGSTNPLQAAAGSIRGDFGVSMPANIIHASDSSKSANREMKIFFSTSELKK